MKARFGIRFGLLALVSLPTYGLDSLSTPSPRIAAAEGYLANCASCHGSTLAGTLGPPLKGDSFRLKWSAKGTASLRDYIARSMPPSDPGGLSQATYDQITTFIQQVNDIDPRGVAVTETGGVAAEVENRDEYYRSVMARRAGILTALRPVDEQMLRNPPPEDWLSWRRTDDGQGFSPLTQINRNNATSLSLAWSLTLPVGTNEITPLVHDGVLFLNSNGTVLAIDVKSSDVLWRFSRPTSVRQIGPPITQARGVAMFQDRLFVPTVDNHILALDIHTGKLIWDHLVSGMSGWMRFSSTPIVVHGIVIQGATGCWSTEDSGKCFVVALDGSTGEEIWRFNTIPHADEPGGETWNGAPYEKRSGASVWSPGTYDAENNLVYFGTGQTYHIATLMFPSSKRAHANAGLYTDSTLALNPDTGKLVWHYQHMARDVWDLDWAFERIVTTLTIDSKPRKVVMTMGKIGILDILDAKTGKYINSFDLGMQNLVTRIDPNTGWKTTNPAMEPEPKQPKSVCPGAGGIRNWPGTSFDPERQLLYVAIADSCMELNWNPGEDFDISYNSQPRLKGDGFGGGVVAINLLARKLEWSHSYRAPEASATLSTAGGLVFEGGRDRRFRASDSGSGAVLWQVLLDNVPSAAPITFAADEVQYVAITTGGGNPNDVIRAFMTPEIEPLPRATTLWVFKVASVRGPLDRDCPCKMNGAKEDTSSRAPSAATR